MDYIYACITSTFMTIKPLKIVLQDALKLTFENAFQNCEPNIKVKNLKKLLFTI